MLDAYCGAGGCGMGYYRAGFDVVGVDIAPQPNYPFQFIQADMLAFLDDLLQQPKVPFVAIHASPPCPSYSSLASMANAKEHPRLIAPTRERLQRLGVPYVIENVPGARRDLQGPIELCGAAFALGTDTHDLARHRLFECNFSVMAPPCAHRSRKVIGIYGDHARTDRRHHAYSQYNAADSLKHGSQAMGIDWMTWQELAQAIPPAFTEHIGHYLMLEVQARAT